MRNLQYIHGRVPGAAPALSLVSQPDRTLFFDFLPLELGIISSFSKTRFQLLYGAGTGLLQRDPAAGPPGRRRAWVFVVDSQARRFDDNLESFQNLQENLLDQGVDVRQLPLVLHNKQDLHPDPRSRGVRVQVSRGPTWRSLHGTGVLETLKALSRAGAEHLAARPPGS